MSDETPLNPPNPIPAAPTDTPQATDVPKAEPEKVLEASLDDWGAALSEQKSADTPIPPPEIPAERAKLEPLHHEALGSGEEDANLDVILDIPVVLSMEVGKTQITIRNLLKLQQGSVIELDRFAGDPLDVYVNGKLIAHGEVVVVNEKFGIRLTDVISASERIKELG